MISLLDRTKMTRLSIVCLLNIILFQATDQRGIHQTQDGKIVKPYQSTASGKFISLLTGSRSSDVNEISPEETWTKTDELHYYSMETDDGLVILNVTTNPGTVANVLSSINDVSQIPSECLLAGSVVDDPSSTLLINHCGGILNGWICGSHGNYYVHGNVSDGFHRLYHVEESSNIPNTIHKEAMAPMNVCLRKHGRNRRSIADDQKFTIELALLVDYTMQTLYGDGTKDYLLKVMNLAAESFKHPSFKFDVEIVITNIFNLDKYNSSLMVGSPTKLRRTVGTYMYNLNTLDDSNPDHFDAGVYITRTNFGPKGYASTGGMCNLLENTVLVRDEGFQSAYVIAHEIGHLLDMEHDDGDGSTCKDGSRFSIMSEEVRSTYNEHPWSKCSNDQLERYLSSSGAWCLKDEPFDELVTRLPGEEYPGVGLSMNDQCKAQQGSTAIRCSTYYSDRNLCEKLWCMEEENIYACYQKNLPALDGTSCGKNKICKDGSCIKAPKMPTRKVVNGGWSAWSKFSECSKSCDVGISSRRRTCTEPEPQNGGKHCEGDKIEHVTCNVQPCPGKKTDMRADMCHNQNQVLIPADAEKDSERCLLTCVSKTSMSGNVVEIDSVPDGTQCSYDEPSSVCINGLCTFLGCDNILGSKAQLDNCGVCDGNNSTCLTTKETFKKKMKKNVYEIANIPEGARHIKVIEKVNTGHSIILRNVDTNENIIDTRSFQWQDVSIKSRISAGVKFTFSVKNNGLRQITTSPGPTLNNLSLKIYKNKRDSKTPSIVCTFVTKETETQFLKAMRAGTVQRVAEPLYKWVKDGTSECSATCGGGFQTEIYKCKRTDNMKAVNDRKCESEPPISKIPCAENACKQYSWDLSEWSECSKSCGQGLMERSVKCVRNLNGKTKSMKPRFCTEISIRPETTEKCNMQAC